MKKYNEESDEEYFLKVDVQYPEKFHKLHNDLQFKFSWNNENWKIRKACY